MTWRRQTLWLAVLLLSGCTLIPPAPALPTPVHPPDIRSTGEALQAAVEGEFPLDALTVRYDVGNEAWEGRTTLVVRGSGAVEVTFEQGGQRQAWQSSLGGAEVLGLCQLLVQHEVWAIRGQRETGVPDEAYPTITVQAEGFEALSVGMWYGEALDHPNFGPIVDALAGLALDLSGGVAK
jgi:hypothetical protein